MTEDSIQKPIRQTLINLAVGEKAIFAVSQYSSVSTTCCNYGFETGRKYSVAKDREQNAVVVTRKE